MIHFVKMLTDIKLDRICLAEWTSMHLLQQWWWLNLIYKLN